MQICGEIPSSGKLRYKYYIYNGNKEEEKWMGMRMKVWYKKNETNKTCNPKSLFKKKITNVLKENQNTQPGLQKGFRQNAAQETPTTWTSLRGPLYT